MRYDFEFLKYEGCGNDFILKDELNGPRTPDRNRSRLAMKLSDRHFWVGGHGILFVESARGVDGSMRLFDPDGNEADMCGNGIRCVAAFLMSKLRKTNVDILTRDGVKHVDHVGNDYRVGMGLVRDRRRDLAKYFTDVGEDSDSLLDIPLEIGGVVHRASLLNSGEPHIVVVTKDIQSVNVTGAGEAVNRDRSRFPRGININFIEIVGPHEIKMRTYERGAYGECLACGTGAVASIAATLKLGLLEPGLKTVTMLGGALAIDVDSIGMAVMTGPARVVFEGRLSIEV